jgi:hypothetical protein
MKRILLTSIALLSFTTAPWADSADFVPLPPEHEGEIFDDPPIAAASQLATEPTRPIVFGSATTFQVNVNAAGFNILGDAANEPSIAVDPLNPNTMAIGWRQFGSVASNFREAGVAFTTDGGRTWTNDAPLDPGVFRSDPVLDYDDGGVFYYSSLLESFDVELYTSFDGGATWLPPVPMFGGDKQWMAVDRSGGPGSGHIYETWSVFFGCCDDSVFTRSVDDGASFQQPIEMPDQPRRGAIDVGPDGTVYLAGHDPFDEGLFSVVRSSDAQNAGATPTFQFSNLSLGGSLVRPSDNFNFPNPNGLNGQVWVATDHSTGPTAGNVYVLCSVNPPGADPCDVRVSRSTNGGVTWSTSVKVNDDPAASGSWQWFGSISVAPNGRIDVTWNDTRSSGVPNQSALYYSFSTDGGVTWSANEQLSAVWNSHVGFPNQNKIGDYYEQVSDDVGVNLAWAATLNGEEDIYYTRIGDWDCNANGVADSVDIALGDSPDGNGNGIPDECESGDTGVAIGETPTGPTFLRQNAPNPFSPKTTISFTVPTGDVRTRIRVFDASGRAVTTLLDDALPAGDHTIDWNGHDARGQRVAGGVYFYRLETGRVRETRSMLLLR